MPYKGSDKDKEYQRKYRESHREYYRKYAEDREALMSDKDKEIRRERFKLAARKRRAGYLKDGLCTQCGGVRATRSKSRCEECLKKLTKHTQAHQKRWKDRGLCNHCGGIRDGEALICCSCSEAVVRRTALRISMAVV